MSSLRLDLADIIESTLRQNGVVSWIIDKTGPHKKYRFEWRGRKLTYVTSNTPSDRRVLERAASDIRALLGVTRKTNKNPENRKKPYRKPLPKPLPSITSITLLPDPWEKLKEMKIGTTPVVTAPTPSAWQRACQWLMVTFNG